MIVDFILLKQKDLRAQNLTARQFILFYPHWLIQLGYLTDRGHTIKSGNHIECILSP